MSQCIVSVGVNPPAGGWYVDGVDRLVRSLIEKEVDWRGTTMLFRGVTPPRCPTHQEVPYGFKLAAIKAARDAGHDQVLWLDTSAWAIANPAPIFQRIEEQGHYFWTSGYKSNEWCNDRSLAYFGVTREQARELDMLYALIIGLDFRSARTQEFFARWEKSLTDGMFNGSWKREEGDNEAPEYKGHRHDQTCATLIAHQLGMSIDGTHSICHLYEENMPETVCMVFQGM